MRVTEGLEQAVLSAAKRMILERGILETDMKDIAKEVGCSRSTLYRHFPGKGDILFALADEAILIIREAQEIPRGFRFANGYEAFVWQINALADALIGHVNEVVFLRDFDNLYYASYSNTNRAEEFKENISGSTVDSPLQVSFNQGLQDGSIRKVDNPELFILTVYQNFLALAERILPHENAYVQAYGYGQEILREHVRQLTNLVKNDHNK